MTKKIKILMIGAYSFKLPVLWSLSVETTQFNNRILEQIIQTSWKIDTGRFTFHIHLRAGGLDDLSTFIEQTTRKMAFTPKINIGDLHGVTYGGFDEPRTWIDWYFKRDSMMLCINLQSNVFPYTEPFQSEIDEIQDFIKSVEHSISA